MCVCVCVCVTPRLAKMHTGKSGWASDISDGRRNNQEKISKCFPNSTIFVEPQLSDLKVNSHKFLGKYLFGLFEFMFVLGKLICCRAGFVAKKVRLTYGQTRLFVDSMEAPPGSTVALPFLAVKQMNSCTSCTISSWR